MASNTPRPEGTRVAVFSKAPVPGEVKTRLAPLLGADGAAALHSGLVLRALAIANESRVGPVELWCAPHADHPFFQRCAEQFRVSLHAQEGVDLGQRMRATIERGLAAGAAVIVIGSDCPSLGASDIREAAAALATHDIAIAPAEDGGYVLIGASRACPAIFERISWGSAAVMGQTRERLAQGGIAWKELARRWDVDRPEDYARLQREGRLDEVMS
jgi:rSAM/selenodomain-associated transferase 1